MNLSNLSLLSNCLHCWAKSVINEFAMGKRREKKQALSSNLGPGQDTREQTIQVSHVDNNNTTIYVHGNDLLLKT